MRHIHVCLVSEQTIPNILGIYHFKPDRIIFCTTNKMEESSKTAAIVNTLKLYGMDYSQKHEKVIVDQDCLDDCELKIKTEIAEKYKSEKLIVNLTGGTKIMVLGAYNALHTVAAQMIYTPIPKNEYIIVHPRRDDCKTPSQFGLRLSVEAYVTAYGVKVKNREKLESSKSAAKKNENLCQWMVQNYMDIEALLSELFKNLRGHRDDRNFRLKMRYNPRNRNENELMKHLGFENNTIDRILQKQEIRFYTGDWLSDFCFNEISALPIDDCVTGIELISPKGTDNEFDVMFTKDNALYILECKSLKQEHDKDADILYKISALQHDFGLRVDGFLVSTAQTILDDHDEIRKGILRRSEQCKTRVIHPKKISDLRNWIKSQIRSLSL